MNKIISYLKNPRDLFISILIKSSKIIPDTLYLKWIYRLQFGRKLNLSNPSTYNEKCNWMKLNDRNPLYTQMADKILAKKYVESILGSGYTIPLIAEYNCVDDIDYDGLPNQFVIKTNHDSGGLCICKDKKNGLIFRGKSADDSLLTYDEVRKILQKSLNTNYYWSRREWPYRNIEKKILVEEYIQTSSGDALKDYKFFCFDGQPKYVWVGTSYAPSYFDVYSIDWVNQHITWGYDNAPSDVPPPPEYQTMLEMAKKLSKGIPHVRVDFFNVDGKVYVGEFTFYAWAGLIPLVPSEWDKKLGDLLDLSKVKR